MKLVEQYFVFLFSYDVWAPEHSTFADVSTFSEFAEDKTACVAARWIDDLEDYNEWMCEEDYLLDDPTVS